MTTDFERMLTIPHSAAQRTLAAVMTERGMAEDPDQALRMIAENPGYDLVGIKGIVIAGLVSLAHSVRCYTRELLSEEFPDLLASTTADGIVLALISMHKRWIKENFTPEKWAQMFFEGQLWRFRNGEKIGFEEAYKYVVFVAEYFDPDFEIWDVEIRASYDTYAKKHPENDDLITISTRARSFSGEIIKGIETYRDNLNPQSDAARIKQINEFLAQHHDGAEIMEIMISAVRE